ncbi:MAG TPA: hypothetical protein VGK19_24575 [Capsulimonadaceae bacterium]|jgi:hypothetical protein
MTVHELIALSHRTIQVAAVSLAISVTMGCSSADPLSLTGAGIGLRAIDNSQVEVSDAAGKPRLILGGYRLAWEPPATDGGTASIVALPDGAKAIQIAYKVKGDETGKTRIQGQFSSGVGRVHIRYDVWGADNIKTTGAMIGCVGIPATTNIVSPKVGRWVRAENGGAPFQVSDGNLFGFAWPDVTAYIQLHGNTDWRDGWSVHFPAVKADAGHFVAEGDIVLTTGRANAAAAILAGRALSLDTWTDMPFNVWDGTTKTLPLHYEASNLANASRNLAVSWTARDFDGRVVSTGNVARTIAAGEPWRGTIDVPAPTRGIVFVELQAKAGDVTEFTRTSLAVMPRYAYRSGDESLFGMANYFPLPTEADSQAMLQRIGVRWLRFQKLDKARATQLGMSQNGHVSVGPDDAKYKDNPATMRAWLDEQLKAADKDDVRYIELCNEWNMGDLNKGSKAKQYVDQVLKPAAEIRKATGARVKIMSQGLAGGDPAFIDKMYDAGGWGSFDAFALHPGRGNFTADYDGTPVDGAPGGNYWNYLGTIRSVKQRIAKYGDKPLFLTEAYCPTHANTRWSDTPRHAAENLLLSYALAASEGVRVVDWYQFNNSVWYNIGGFNPKDSEYDYGIVNQDLSPKPSLLAYQTIAEAMDQAKFVRWITFDGTANKGLLFDTPRGPMAVLWNRADGYVLNRQTEAAKDTYATPEPWTDEWKTKTPLTVKALASNVTEIDCIGRRTTIPAKNGRVTLTLDGAPRIYYGLPSTLGK